MSHWLASRRTVGAGVLSLGALATALWAMSGTGRGPLTVTFLDVGQGDSIVLRTPKGAVMVVDTGGRTPDDDQGRRVVLPFLRSQGINRIDALVLTHPDEDHIGGALTLLERVSISKVLVSRLTSPSPSYRRLLNEANKRRIAVACLARGQTLASGDGVTASVLNPTPVFSGSENNGSVALMVRYGSTSMLLTGDAETPAEDDILRSCPSVHADILKLGHHGSLTSSSEVFLDAVHPAAAIVSAGKRNLFGHPHPFVLDRLARRGIRVFRTDKDGAITVTSDGRYLRIAPTVKADGR